MQNGKTDRHPTTGAPVHAAYGLELHGHRYQSAPDDIDAIINRDRPGSATTFCVHAGDLSGLRGRPPQDWRHARAEPGKLAYVGSGHEADPRSRDGRHNGTENLLSTFGADISIKWVDLRGARGTGKGTGSAIAAGSADSDFLVQFSRIHNNDSVGISNAKGRILDSEFFSNSQASGSIGFNGWLSGDDPV